MVLSSDDTHALFSVMSQESSTRVSDRNYLNGPYGQFAPGFHNIAIFPNTDHECKKVVRGR